MALRMEKMSRLKLKSAIFWFFCFWPTIKHVHIFIEPKYLDIQTNETERIKQTDRQRWICVISSSSTYIFLNFPLAFTMRWACSLKIIHWLGLNNNNNNHIKSFQFNPNRNQNVLNSMCLCVLVVFEFSHDTRLCLSYRSCYFPSTARCRIGIFIFSICLYLHPQIFTHHFAYSTVDAVAFSLILYNFQSLTTKPNSSNINQSMYTNRITRV